MSFLKPYISTLPLIILCGALALWLASKYLNYAVPMYESTAKMRMADINEGVPGNNLFKDLDVFASETKIMAEIEVMKSKVIIDKVIDQLGIGYSLYRKGKLRQTELFDDSPIRIDVSGDATTLYGKQIEMVIHDTSRLTLYMPDGTLSEGNLDKSVDLGTVKIMVSRKTEEKEKKLKLEDKYLFELKARESIISELQAGLDITPVDKDVPVVRISYKSNNPAKAATIVNAVAENYIRDYIAIKYQSADITSQFLDKQINDMSSRLEKSENQIQNYRDKNNIINVRQETETDLRKISQLKIQETNLKMNLEAMDQLNQYITSGKDNFLELAPNFEAFTDLLSTEMIKKIKELQSEKKQLLLTYTPEDDRVKVIDSKITDYTTYLEESISNTRKNLQTKYNNLKNDIADAEKVFIGLPEKEKLLTIMNREFDLYQNSYIFLNNKKIEADVAKEAKYSFHRILSPAAISKTPVSPNRTIIRIVSLLLGLFLGIAAVAAKEMFFPAIRNEDGIESRSTIPVAYKAENFKNKNTAASFFRRNLIDLQVRDVVKSGKMTVFSSLHGNEHHSYQVAHMARAMASAGNRVLIVDVDGNFGKKYTTDHQNIHIQDLSAVFNGHRPEAMEDLKNLWLSKYDHVLVSNEKIKEGELSPVFLRYADANFFVSDSRITSAEDIAEINKAAAEYNVINPYFVLNRANYSPNIFRRIMAVTKKIGNKGKTQELI